MCFLLLSKYTLSVKKFKIVRGPSLSFSSCCTKMCKSGFYVCIAPRNYQDHFDTILWKS